MAPILVVLGIYFVYPIVLLAINSFNTAAIGQPASYGLDNWRIAFDDPVLFETLGNTFLVFGLTLVIAFPIAVFIAWSLARLRMPFSHGLEFMFWVAFMIPGISSTLGWMLILDPKWGLLNVALSALPFIDNGGFNIFSVPGIVWTHLVGGAIASKVMLLTPAFRNMDAALEEAARVSGASHIRTMIRVTLPVMIPPMVVVFALNMSRMFSSFEVEQLLGVSFRFFVYSTRIWDLVSASPPLHGQATALASITLVLVALIIPVSRWLLHRRIYTTVTGTFRPGLIDLGVTNRLIFWFIVFLLFLLILAPILSLLMGSFMIHLGFFDLDKIFTLRHWEFVLAHGRVITALRNTLSLAMTTALVSPILFSLLAYIIVRTRWPGRAALDSLIWVTSAIPGMISGLGLLWVFLGTPVVSLLYGTLVPLMLVIILQGNTLGVQLSKAVMLQVGSDMEEASRVAGAGWLKTYLRIWLPLMMPTLILIGVFNFVFAAGTTSSIILLATRGTDTLSILALEWGAEDVGMRQAASILSILLMGISMGVALIARAFGLRMGIRHH